MGRVKVFCTGDLNLLLGCRRMKKWGMDSYLYAPKDDYKHRAFWRELYSVEEAEHLTGLIGAARENGIHFYYALSPGLDITYSSVKEVTNNISSCNLYPHFCSLKYYFITN